MSFSKIIYNALRFTAASVLLAEKRLTQRNREVLMTAGLENAERMVEREFDRIGASVTRDLEGYPNVHRQVSEVITKLDEDYNESADVPPSLPNWMPIIESIAKIKAYRGFNGRQYAGGDQPLAERSAQKGHRGLSQLHGLTPC